MQIEKRPVTWPQLIGWGGLAVTQAFAAGVIWSNLNVRLDQQDVKLLQMENGHITRLNEVQARLVEIGQATEILPNLTYRLDQVEKRDQVQETRIDRLADAMNIKLDGINENVNGIRTEIRVLSSKVETILPREGKASSIRRPASTPIIPSQLWPAPGLIKVMMRVFTPEKDV